MKFENVAEYKKEIARVQSAIDSTCSEFLRRDYGKYMKKLKKEMRRLRK